MSIDNSDIKTLNEQIISSEYSYQAWNYNLVTNIAKIMADYSYQHINADYFPFYGSVEDC